MPAADGQPKNKTPPKLKKEPREGGFPGHRDAMAGGAHPYFGMEIGEGGEPLSMPAYNGLGGRYESAGRVARSMGRQRGGRKSAL